MYFELQPFHPCGPTESVTLGFHRLSIMKTKLRSLHSHKFVIPLVYPLDVTMINHLHLQPTSSTVVATLFHLLPHTSRFPCYPPSIRHKCLINFRYYVSALHMLTIIAHYSFSCHVPRLQSDPL